MPGPTPPPPDPTAGSRLLPVDRRTPVQAAPTTSTWWRALVLGRGWLNTHRQRWLGPALVCAPPVGVAMLWAGASRPGHQRRWLTAGAVAWTLALLAVVLLLTVPGAQPAGAGAVPAPLAGGAVAPGSPSPSGSAADPVSAPADRSAAVAGGAAIASSAAEVRGAPARTSGVGGAAVARDEDPTTAGGGAATSVPRAAGTPGAAVPAAPPAAPATTAPGPSRTPVPSRTASPKPPAVTTANPFSTCTREGALAVSPNGWSLKCFRTPIGLYWLYGQ